MNSASRLAFDLTEQGIVPDAVTRRGIKLLLKQRLREIRSDNLESGADRFNRFILQMGLASVAPVPEKANDQHYELPTRFFQKVLGPQLKYSCGHWPAEVGSLAEAERAALRVTCERAGLNNGQSVLELGCGWGALSLWMAEHYPKSLITAVSNSNSQREYIEEQAMLRRIGNLRVITCDMNNFETQPAQYDQVVSVEMFEHMRNWATLYARIARWLKPGGHFFKHIFVHRSTPYLFEDRGPNDWMSRHFFAGGMMPSDDLPLAFQRDLRFMRRWRWDGTHYEKTANAWLEKMDQNRGELWPLFLQVYGQEQASAWWNRWRLFFMACAELFGYDRGQQWLIGHYLFEKPGSI